MIKKALVIGGVIILGSVFFVGCTRYIPDAPTIVELPEKSETVLLLEHIKEFTALPFSDVVDDAVVWHYFHEGQVKSKGLEGSMVEARNLMVSESVIEEFFTQVGFIQDEYNVADGVYAGQKGFQKDQMVCTVVHGYNPVEESEIMTSNITIRCAEFYRPYEG